MSIIIFFSASKKIFFCRNDVQATDFLRKGSYAPDIIKDHQTNVLSTIPRRTGRQINRAGHPADNPSQFWQQFMYYPFMNYYITEFTGC
jgi:hypothetical protein